jgi:hypothetical protein
VTDLHELRRLEPWFYRAPSAHNAQPWLLLYGADRIELRFDPDRHLAAGDPTRRDLLLSLGAFVEAVLVASAAEGIALDFVSAVDIAQARVGAFTAGVDVYETPFGLNDLERRGTSRLRYAPRRLGQQELEAARRQLGPGERLQDVPARQFLDLFTTADRWLYESSAVVAELRSWLRLSRRHPRYELDGLSYECLGLSRAEASAVGLLLRPGIYRLVRTLGLHRAFTASSRSALEVDASVLVLTGPAEREEEILAAGRSLLRVWLSLSSAGCYTHPLSQLIDCGTSSDELGRRLELGPGERLLSVFRAGWSERPARSHRLVDVH